VVRASSKRPCECHKQKVKVNLGFMIRSRSTEKDGKRDAILDQATPQSCDGWPRPRREIPTTSRHHGGGLPRAVMRLPDRNRRWSLKFFSSAPTTDPNRDGALGDDAATLPPRLTWTKRRPAFSPATFQTPIFKGVGMSVRRGIEKRAVKTSSNLKLGSAAEHGGERGSVKFRPSK